MLRTAVRATRTFSPRACRSAVVVPRMLPCVRHQSTTPIPEDPTAKRAAAFEAAQKLSDDLQRDWDAPVITFEQLLPKTQSPSPDAYLIDVREPDEVVQGMIPSAVNLPLSVLSNSLHLSPDVFQAKHGFPKPKKAQELTFYCRSGKRSTSASDVAKRNGYTEIKNYKGSWLEWVEKGGEISK